MSEEARAPARRSKTPFKVRGPRDFYGGLAMIAFALFALWASSDLPGQHGFTFGPGTAPRLFAGVLAAIGVLIAVNGLLFDGAPIERFAVRGPAFVLVAILAFAAMIQGVDYSLFGLRIHVPPLGLVMSTLCAFMTAIAGSKEVRWIEGVLAAIVMTAFCVTMFVYLLELPFQLWPDL